MELDGYCEELKLAFEYHGEQHYKRKSLFQKSEKEFNKRLSDDAWKRRKCEEYGITLVEVPYNIPLEELDVYIIDTCKTLGIAIPKGWEKKQLDLATAYSPKLLREMQNIAKSKGGKCLSDKYVHSRSKLVWECNKGHQFETNPEHVKQGVWCPECAGVKRKTIEEMQALAESKGGKCISAEYSGMKSKLLWECEKGHIWETASSNIRNGHWCAVCAGRNKSIDDMRLLAKTRGGRCLSSEYLNSSTKLQWECEKGHRWEATPEAIQQGRWCHTCGGYDRVTIKQLREAASARGGKCISPRYIDSSTPLEWECEKGHRWMARAADIKGGYSWCPECSGKRRKTIEQMRELAISRGGKCLSDSYVNNKTHLLWECAEGHQWKAIPSSIARGRWCPKCCHKKSKSWNQPP